MRKLAYIGDVSAISIVICCGGRELLITGEAGGRIDVMVSTLSKLVTFSPVRAGWA